MINTRFVELMKEQKETVIKIDSVTDSMEMNSASEMEEGWSVVETMRKSLLDAIIALGKMRSIVFKTERDDDFGYFNEGLAALDGIELGSDAFAYEKYETAEMKYKLLKGDN